MARRGSIYIPNLVSFFILALVPLFPHFWFVLPTAVCILSRSRSPLLKIIPWLTLATTAFVSLKYNVALTELDLLSLVILFLEGLCLHWILRTNARFNYMIFLPLIGGFIFGLVLFVSSRMNGLSPSFQAWSEAQARSVIFPYFFHPQDWPDAALGVYQTLFVPIIRSGLLAWFASMTAVAFFVNGIFENILRGKTNRRPRIWVEFNSWKAPDWILISLIIGLLTLGLNKSLPAFSGHFWELLGWHLTILSLFPVFIQGIALASYFIPRVPMVLFVVIFVLLLFKPIPVLMLAGLSDLWFDFRSKIRSDPRI